MQMIIGGKKTDASDGAVITVRNPATRQVIDTVPSATIDDIERMLLTAQEGKKKWADTPVYRRKEILYNVADRIDGHAGELALLLSQELGKPQRHCLDEIGNVCRLFRGYADRMAHLNGFLMPKESQQGIENDMTIVVHEPIGVVACVVPFNFPLELYAQKAAPALAAGNAVVVKPASDTPLACIRMTELIIEGGVPAEAVQIITGRGSVIGSALSSSPLIDVISLTGSTEVGIDIARNAARHLRRVYLELGGNDAVIVFDDADLEHALTECVNGRIFNGGQVCCGSKRFVVQNGIRQRFIDGLIKRLEKVHVGDPLNPESDMGPLVSEAAAAVVEEQVNKCLAQGAKCVYGGKRYDGCYFQPTVLVDVTTGMDIARNDEVFGPVFPIIGFETEDEAVAIVNASQYGLSGGVLTSDYPKAMRVARNVDTGTMVINGCSVYRSHDMPFGGHKMSGIGTEGFLLTLEEMLQTKSIVMKNILAK